MSMDLVRHHRRTLLAGLVVLALLVRAFIFGLHVPLLSYVDLGFHELGHMLAVPLGTVIHFLAGSFTQIAVPLGLAVYFWIKVEDRAATALMLGWTATSAQNTSVYVADAPTRALPLIGGTHDWWFLLSRWDALHLADGLAGMVWVFGLVIGAAGLLASFHPMWSDWRSTRTLRSIEERFATAPVREVRPPAPIDQNPAEDDPDWLV